MKKLVMHTHTEMFADILSEDYPFPIEEIAIGLSRRYRWAAMHHGLGFTVARHCINMSHEFDKPMVALCALLHDAAEAYIGDMIAPIKILFPQFSHIENKIHRLICLKNGVDPIIPLAVHSLDIEMREAELCTVFRNNTSETPSLQLDSTFTMLEDQEIFVSRFYHLKAQLNG